MHITAVLAGYRKALVGPGWAVSLLVSTNNRRNHFSAFLGPPFGHYSRQFLSEGVFAGQKAIECSLMSDHS